MIMMGILMTELKSVNEKEKEEEERVGIRESQLRTTWNAPRCYRPLLLTHLYHQRKIEEGGGGGEGRVEKYMVVLRTDEEGKGRIMCTIATDENEMMTKETGWKYSWTSTNTQSTTLSSSMS